MKTPARTIRHINTPVRKPAAVCTLKGGQLDTMDVLGTCAVATAGTDTLCGRVGPGASEWPAVRGLRGEFCPAPGFSDESVRLPTSNGTADSGT